MNTADSADELIRLCIDGMDRMIRIAGVGAKNIGVMLIALSKDKKQTRGKTRLNNMLKTGKPLQIFVIKAEDLKKFSQEAKKYGILYCVLANKKNSKIDGEVDILVRDEDAPKMNRIAERFNFRSTASIKKEPELEKETKEDNEERLSTEDEQFIEEIMPVNMEEDKEIPSNDKKDTEKKSLSKHSSAIKTKDKKDNSESKKSVRRELRKIETELKSKKEKPMKKETRTKEDTRIKKGKHLREPKHLETANKKRKMKKGAGRNERS